MRRLPIDQISRYFVTASPFQARPLSASRPGSHMSSRLGPAFRLAVDTTEGCETTPEPSTRGVVDITQDVGLKLQILQPMLDHIADADDTG
jgi:hypothetical protein